ncbi:MAG TPA: class I SAM-dependent methyltransferase [Stellaceae bacterium]|nr:class I SAM-dependent methyltransferase [Stellaceae bacterium]
MAEPQIRFNDGAAYEKMMGTWSRLVGDVFLDWLAPAKGLSWVDVGCGNGAFTQAIVDRCAPSAVKGIDPSEGQLAFARQRPAARVAQFDQGNAMALPYGDNSFDAGVMALVIFFVPDPAKGIAELARVVRPGGLIATYAWDMFGGGFPMQPIQAEMPALGINPPAPPSAPASRIDAMRALWSGAGIGAIETREITVERGFASFDDFWTSTIPGASALAALPPDRLAELKERVRPRLPTDAAGRITYSSRANAIKGRLPK